MTFATKAALPFMAVSSLLLTGIARAEEVVQEIVTEVAATPEVAEHAEAHASGGLPQFDPSSWPSQIFWLAVFFVILYTIYARAILPSIGGTITRRADYVQNQLKAAEELSKQADSLRAEVEAGLKEAGQTAAAALQTAESTAQANMATALGNFRARFETTVEQTEAKIIAAKSEAMGEMEKIAANLAAQAAAKIADIPANESQAEDIVRNLARKAA